MDPAPHQPEPGPSDGTAGPGEAPAEETADRPSERERELAALAAIQAELADVDRALQRIDDGSYGTCEACGQAISDEVLDRTPVTRLCAVHGPAG